MPIQTLVKTVKGYLPTADEKRLKKAYDFAEDAHKGQLRMDGSPYIQHPLEAANILATLHVDEPTLIACLLHDVPEDTEHTLEEIKKEFGKTVAFLVDGVTKLSKLKYRHNMAERQIESLKKFFLHSAKDLRIILIKLADRLHNMRTLGFVRPDKQERIARETMEIHVPIANLLGIWQLKSELENLCFEYLYSQEYQKIKTMMEKTAPEQEKTLQQTARSIKEVIKKYKIKAEVQFRPKSLFSIFRKMVDQGQRLEDLNDLLAMRIIVKDRETCYLMLGVLHSLFRPKAGRIKDYIATPKANGYQSLHTTVFGVNGTPTEFQIRTKDMHYEAEYGIAAHYFYKADRSKVTKQMQKRSQWVKKILEIQKELKSNYDFLENLKVDVFQDRIFVFTPHGDVVDLPEGATGIDFAYHIHTDLGNHAVRLLRNGRECPIITVLKTGDTLEVISSKEQRVPPRDWLTKVRTNLARNKIKMSLKRQSSAISHSTGIELLKREFKRYGCGDLRTLTKKQKDKLLQKFHMESWKEFLEMVGNGTIREHQVIESLYSKKQLLGTPYRTSPALSQVNYRKTESRLIKLQQKSKVDYYRIHLDVRCRDRVGFLRDIGIELANLGVNIYQIGVFEGKTRKEVRVDLVVEVVDLDQLRSTFNALESVEGILCVQRVSSENFERGKVPISSAT